MTPFSIDIVAGRIASAVPAGRSRLRIDGRDVPLPTGSIILPGFVDTHCHLIGLGEMAGRVQLRGAVSAADCAERVAARAGSVPRGEWVVGFGWNQEEWDAKRLPDRTLLDRVAPEHPVILLRIDTHAAWVNSAALAAAGIDGISAAGHAVEGGSIELDERGTPTGILVDHAIDLIRRVMPEPGLERKIEWLENGVAECLRMGITEIHDMNVEPERLEPMTRLAEEGGMRLRCNVFTQAQGDQWHAVPHPAELARNLAVVGVKYFADGALGSYGAYLLEPYADRPETRGIRLLTADELAGRAAEPARRGFAVATHAIGDGANRIVLDAYARLRAALPEAILRVEHAQIVHPDDVGRFREHAILPAMQAIHCTSDAPMAEARLGPDRSAYAYGWRSLLETGVPILGGSDFPIESGDPLLGLRSFVERRELAGGMPWHPEQRISAADAIGAYTANAPFGIPGRVRRGRLAEGFDADLTVLSGDPLDGETGVVMTIVGGRIEYRAS